MCQLLRVLRERPVSNVPGKKLCTFRLLAAEFHLESSHHLSLTVLARKEKSTNPLSEFMSHGIHSELVNRTCLHPAIKLVLEISPSLKPEA